MAKITTIKEENGTTVITDTTARYEMVLASGGWTNGVAQLKDEATHLLSRYERDEMVLWMIEWIKADVKTCPLYRANVDTLLSVNVSAMRKSIRCHPTGCVLAQQITCRQMWS